MKTTPKMSGMNTGPIFPTPETYEARKEQVLSQHIAAADLCHEKREAEALPILRRVATGLQALQAERRDSAVSWRYVLALHSLGISALVMGQNAEAAAAAATALAHARAALPYATGDEGRQTIEREIAALERLEAATGAGVVFLASDGGAWPYGD